MFVCVFIFRGQMHIWGFSCPATNCTQQESYGIHVDPKKDLCLWPPVLASTVWFKINLTLFNTRISHKWNSIMYLFDNIYKAWYLGIMWWKWKMKKFTHTQNQWGSSHRRVYYRRSCTDFSIYRLSCVHDDTTVQYNTSNKAP